MGSKITRRDFLKVAGLLPLSVAAPRFATSLQEQQEQQNIIVIVFDAFSAQNISLYGYQRETTPNIAKWAERAVVYHNHYAGGNYTTPGTASLLSGTLPWAHRAFRMRDTVVNHYVDKSIFSAFRGYHRITYSQNRFALTLLRQFEDSVEKLVPLERLLLTSDGIIANTFRKDDDIATVSWARAIKRKEGYAYSLFLTHLYEKYQKSRIADLRPEYPRGIPSIGVDNFFILGEVIDWLGRDLKNYPEPFTGYFHLMPPHAPYRAHRDFHGRFEGDNLLTIQKSNDLFSKPIVDTRLMEKRKAYDEFILNVDREIDRLFNYLEKSRVLENTWIVLTSDHGEMFERGIEGHRTPVLYEPVVRIPLMIFEPGRKERIDVHTPTSAIDVLPTMLHVTGQRQVEWSEGDVLPPYHTGKWGSERSIYVLEAKRNEKYAPFSTATVALIKGRYKLMYFFGYEELGAGGERVELYDLENDPEELNNLYRTKRETSAEMLHELKTKMAEVNEPYQ